MGQVQQQARRQQRLEELCGATIRALSGDRELQLRARGLYRGRQRIALPAPHLQTDPDDDLVDYRGAADGMALRLCYSDPQLHRARCPQAPLQRLVFELLEQLRVESLVPARLPGVAHNVAERFARWSQALHRGGLSDSAVGILVYTLAQVCWSRLNARPVLAETEDLIEATRAGIVPLIGHELAALKRYRSDQARFADAALSLAATIDGLVDAEMARSHDDASAQRDEALAALRPLLLFDDGDDATIGTVASGRSRVFADAAIGYRVFTRAYDREVDAADLVRPALLGELRARLDRQVQAQGLNAARLARRLAALFARPARDGWAFGEEEGRIDGRRLAQLVSSPAERRLFRRERVRPVANAVVSFLIDCSGSMKAHSDAVALLVDVFGRALHQAGVASEVLGFTTGAWNGGRAQRDWLAHGRPAHPGRLNEVTHVVFKGADSGWRRSRRAIAALLKPDLFREGIDGEAVDWACARLRGRDECDRALIVISDGCPMDGATKLANDAYYLDNHLKDVVAAHERAGDVAIFGLGVGLDLSPYYRRCLALDLSNGLDNGAFDEIVQLLAGRHRR
ncbi:MAG: cobalt chelatase [Gammaproteobacteria bacterium]|nr:cobalt chelatase [Gammaproteobacteria bacterium]